MPQQDSAVDAPTLSGHDDAANYVIYPKDVDNQDQAKSIQTLVESVKPGHIYVSSSDHGAITWFWGVSLTSENAEKVRADPNVRMCSHFQSKGSGTDESRSLQSFKNAQPMLMIRQIYDPPSSQSKRSDDGAKYEERSRVVKRDGQIILTPPTTIIVGTVGEEQSLLCEGLWVLIHWLPKA